MEMANASILFNNLTKESIVSSKSSDFIKLYFLILLIIGACIFLCLTVTMLYIVFTTPELCHNTRYILLAFMLTNDSLYFILCFYLYISVFQAKTILMPLCCVLYTLSIATFIATLYCLAAMSLECYIAICFPLRHCVICTPRRAVLVAMTIWVCSTMPYVVESVIIGVTFTDSLHLEVICMAPLLLKNVIQTIIRLLNFVFCFTFVGLTILFSYIKIMSVALSKNSNTSSASKAGKTVLIHGVQLFLCMCSLLSNVTEVGLGKYVELWPVCSFVLFAYLPRFLSPLIYGIRDAALRRHIKKHLHPAKKMVCL